MKTEHKIKTEWNLKLLLTSDNDPLIPQKRKEIEKQYNKFIAKWVKRNDYLTDPKTLKTALDEYENLMHFWGDGGDEYYYFELRSALDQNNPEVKAKYNSAFEFVIKLQNEIQFFILNISKIPLKMQSKLLGFNELLPYRHFLERQFKEGKYLLSDAEEKILNLKYSPAHDKWVKMLSGFLFKEEKIVVDEKNMKVKANLSTLMGLISNPNKKVRDTAALATNEIFNQYLQVGEHEINAILTDKKINDELRGMERPELSRLLYDDIDIEIIDQLVSAVSSENDISRRFYQLKAKLLKLPKLEFHERNLEYGALEKTYLLEEAMPIVQQTLASLDPEFLAIFNSYFENGQVDVYPKSGKRGGAAGWHNNLSQPSYVILNYNGLLHDVTTIAHEVGHGINNELMKQKQHALNFGSPLSTAEIASQVFEDFVIEEISHQADDEMRLAINMMRLNDAISSIFRQVACFKFEQELHREFRAKGYLSHQEIGKIFLKHMESYMGPGVIQSEGSENWWLYWGHIRNFFYVYSYASGLLISKYIQNQIRKDKNFVSELKYFMSAGRSESPKQIFRNMGMEIDNPKFWKIGLLEISDLLKETEKLAKKLGKI